MMYNAGDDREETGFLSDETEIFVEGVGLLKKSALLTENICKRMRKWCPYSKIF